MNIHFQRCGTIALMLTGALCMALSGTASAQGLAPSPSAAPTTLAPSAVKPGAPLVLTPEQKSAIFAAIQQDNKKITPPQEFQVSVGAEVPPSIELYSLPDGVMASTPTARVFKYTKLREHVVLVDPTNMRIAEVLKP
jgi:hypothetical protein